MQTFFVFDRNVAYSLLLSIGQSFSAFPPRRSISPDELEWDYSFCNSSAS